MLVRSLRCVHGWKTNPVRMIAQLIVSAVVGQVVFWKIGYDQLGVGMDPKKQFGLGVRIADDVARMLPDTAAVAWTVKALEITADFGKMPIEGAAYVRHGIVPDVVACAVTQPLWSAIEGVEKTVGVLLHPERVHTPEQVRLSLGCIYGSMVRYALGAAVIVGGRHLNRFLTDPLERLIRLGLRAAGS